jgi:dTDP-glucose 4,6-dehydratase
VLYIVKKYLNYDIYNLELFTYARDLTKHHEIGSKENNLFVKAGITDREAIMYLFEKEKFNYVVHFVAESYVDRSITKPIVICRINVFGAQMLYMQQSK